MITEPKKRDVALVVDDSPETLRLLTDALDGAGMTVMVALDGASAMQISSCSMRSCPAWTGLRPAAGSSAKRG
jgi:PleD family two-component response regulator